MINSPTSSLRRGDLDQPLYVLSLPDIRNAEILSEQTIFDTADGQVVGRQGDVAITAYEGERYPILSQVFYGTYEVLGRVGARVIGRRLVHVRRAWPIRSADAEFDYSDNRGVVSVARGGWLYQSDETDFGVINPNVNERGHVVVGSVIEVDSIRWEKRFNHVTNLLTFLPCVLTLLALAALAVSLSGHKSWVRDMLLILETMLLLAGATGVWWMRRDRWWLKAALSTGQTLASDFQVAVELLGHERSKSFPQMALWRAAQTEHTTDYARHSSKKSCAMISRATMLIGETIEEMRARISRHHLMHRLVNASAVIAIVMVVASNLWLVVITHITALELLVVWLPALIGALHVLNDRKFGLSRMSLLLETISKLIFVKQQLLATFSLPQDSDSDHQSEAALKLLCKVIGHYCQEELRLAIAQEPQLVV